MSSTASHGVERTPVDYDPFAGPALARVVPTTEPQREVWLADRLGREASLAYNESISLRFSGTLNIDALRGALQDLVQRHESLRATISADGEELCVAGELALNVPLTDHGALSAPEQETAIAAARQRAVEMPFDLERGPLFRAEILRLGPSDHLLVVTAHHIVCDGWSFGVLVRDLASLYASRVGEPAKDLGAPASFGDYALAQNAATGSSGTGADEAYWLSRFTGPIPTLDLPTDRSRSAWRTFTSRREDYDLDADLVSELRKSGSRNGASLFATMLGGFAALLQRIAGSNDIVVGVPAAGQSVGGLDKLIGHCVNLLPLRVEVDAATPMKAVVAATQTAVLDAYEHQSYTFGTLLTKLAIKRDPSRLPLVSVMFNLDQALDADTAGFPGLRAEFASNPRSYENFELFVNAVQIRGALRLECQYNADLFDGASVRRWLACYEMLLRGACASMETSVGSLPLISSDDQRLLAQWNDTSQPLSTTLLVHELIEAQTSRVPERTAVTWRGTALTYGALEVRANRVAHSLRARGICRGSLVGLHMERGPDMVAVMLAVLKAGAAYVPLDPSYPRDRLAFMAEDAALSVLVTEKSLASPLAWPRERSLFLDDDAGQIAAQPGTRLPKGGSTSKADDPAYVIYTSGSTGKPKGVQVPHRAVINFLESMAREPGLTQNDRLVAVTTLSFDIAVNELLLPLSVGAEIVLAARDDAADGATLGRLIDDSLATTMQATPATWRLLIGARWKGSRRFKVLCGGEALSVDLARQLLERTDSLWNMYGPTETTVWSTCLHITGAECGISIGRPIANTSVWILDEAQQLCPIGVPGEICIGGGGVSMGYLNRPELTAERFLPDPFSKLKNARLYRTGDRGRWRADGLLEHLGRLDFQVKVRGYRIELGEIEVSLALHPDVVHAVVIAREDRPGDVRLVAYLVAKPGTTLADGALKAHLKTTLPDYMIPLHFVTLADIPLMPNGKVDRKSLPAPHLAARPVFDYVAPRTDLEKMVAAEMEASLGMPGVGVNDDFFTLGGHSLLAAQLTYRLNRRFKTSLSMRTLFEAPTVARLATIIEAESTTASATDRPPIQRLVDQSRVPASLMQERLWFLEKIYPGRVVYHAPSAHRLQGIMNEAAFAQAFQEMMRRQSSMRTSFEGEGSTVMQHIHDNVPVSLFPAEDLSGLTPQDRETRLAQRLDELTAETFDLTRAPLFKVRMFRMGDHEHVLFFMAHHIIWDGWSFDLFYDEMSALYGAFSEGRASPLTDLPVSYGDFSAWHRKWIKGPDFGKQLTFWRKRLTRIGKPRELPTDKPRRPGMSGAGATEWIVIDKARTDALHGLSEQSGATLFVTLLAAYSVLLYDYARQTNLVVGMPVRGRNSVEFEPIMGYFNNLLPLQLEINPLERFDDLIKRVKATVIESFTYPDVPLEQLSRELPVARGEGGAILYQALFSFQDARQRITQWGGLRHSVIPLFPRGATEDLGMWFVESPNGLHGGLTHNTDILNSSTAHRLRERYLAILSAVIASPATTVATLAGPSKYMAAARSVEDDASPLTMSGNAERNALPQPAPDRAVGSRAYVAPRNDLEISLATVWERVLGVQHVGITESFFELGGNSLSAISLILEMKEATGIEIDLGEVFRFPTIAGLVNSFSPEATINASAVVPLQREGDGIPIFCVVGINLYREFAESLGKGQPVYGVYVAEEQALVQQSIRGDRPDVSIDRLADAYYKAIARFHPHGPYRLAGLSFGGILAMELASRIRRGGAEVDLVILLETMLPHGMHRNWTKWLFHQAAEIANRHITQNIRRLFVRLRDKLALLRLRPGIQTHLNDVDRANEFRRIAFFHATRKWDARQLIADFRVMLIRGTDHSEWGPHTVFDEDYGWRRYLTGPFFIVNVPGNHLSIVETPNVADLGQKVLQYMASESGSAASRDAK